MTVNPREGKPIKRKGLDTGKFRSCSRARAVWEYARLRQLYMCVRENKDAKSYLFAQCFSACTEKNAKQRASKHCFHTEGHGSQANFWISWETNASKRFPPVISSPSMVCSLASSGKSQVVLSQRTSFFRELPFVFEVAFVSLFGCRQASCNADLELLPLPLTIS